LSEIDDYIKAKRYRLVNSVLVCVRGDNNRAQSLDDEIVFERYYNGFGPGDAHAIKSIWKSLLSLALGVCADAGLVKSLDDPVSAYLPLFDGRRDARHARIKIRHLLTMSSGIYFSGGVHYHCPQMAQLARDGDWLSFIADVNVASEPGTSFVYKEWDILLLSALIAAAAQKSVAEFCREKIFAPLGAVCGEWPDNGGGIEYNVMLDGIGDAKLTARDLAKLGLLMLGGGAYFGERIVSEGYVGQSVAPSAACGGYGFMWRLSSRGFHGRGFGGQELNVYPAEGVVAVVQATATPSGKSYGDICEGIMEGFA